MIRRVAGLAISTGLILVSCTSVQDTVTTTVDEVPPTTSSTTSHPATTTSTVPGPASTSTSTTPPTTTTLALSDLRLTLEEIDSGFASPVLLVADPGGGADLIVEQPGRIVRADGGTHEVVLDIRDDVRFEGEQGLLGLAFHPDFANNDLAYVNYTDNQGRTTIEQYTVSEGAFALDSRLIVLIVDQPAGNHNGGMIAFGPQGSLWIGMGDGGRANDRFGNGQDPHTLLGSLLRISVPGTDGLPYDIPAVNPFVDGVDGAPEVWAIGLRNPWRFAIDGPDESGDGDIWIADVGQGDIEEVNVVSSGLPFANFGWPIMEGSSCFQSDDCDPGGITLPVTEYTHAEGCSITGGYVYRGPAMPELHGHFFYSDFCAGFVRSVSTQTGDHDWTEQTGTIPRVSGFGVGGDREMYIVSLDGVIYRITRAS